MCPSIHGLPGILYWDDVFVSLVVREQYNYFQTLLLHIKGLTSFTDIQLFQGTVYFTFRVTALACGLYENDEEWDRCLQEAMGMQSALILYTFVTILRFGRVAKPCSLWTQHASNQVTTIAIIYALAWAFGSHGGIQAELGLYFVNKTLECTHKI